MDSLVTQLSSIERSSFQNNERGLRATLKAARQLVQRLERPSEKVMRMVWVEPILLMAVRTASEMGLLAHLDDEPQTSGQLAEAIGAEALLVSRLLRMLGSCGVVDEVDVDRYVGTDFSASLKDRQAIVSGIYHFYDVGIPQLARMPHYLRETGYRNPSDYDHPPWEYVMGSPNYWDWFKTHPDASAEFNTFLAYLRSKQSPWPGYYPVSGRLLEDYDPTRPLVVDVGGGKGSDLRHLASAISREHSDAKLVLQDTQEVIDSVEKVNLPTQIQTMAHNFFDAQPVQTRGAKAYFMRSVLHDWPDKQAVQILKQLKAAMKPGYSKILVLEAVIPERVADVTPLMAAMDINMMAHFAALERTEKQWRSLFESAGLSHVGFYEHRGNNHGIIEVELCMK